MAATTVVPTTAVPVTRPRLSDFYGDWFVHGGGATFRADRTGRLFNHAGFEPDGTWVNEVTTVRTTLSEDGSTLSIIVTEDHFEDPDGAELPNPSPGALPSYVQGDTVRAAFVAPHELQLSYVKMTNPDAFAAGNSYLCQDGIAPDHRLDCGA